MMPSNPNPEDWARYPTADVVYPVDPGSVKNGIVIPFSL